MVPVMARHEGGLLERRPRSRATLSPAKAKGNYQAGVHSDQMVLVAVRWEAGLVAGGQEGSNEKWKTRQPGDLTENRQSDSVK